NANDYLCKINLQWRSGRVHTISDIVEDGLELGQLFTPLGGHLTKNLQKREKDKYRRKQSRFHFSELASHGLFLSAESPKLWAPSRRALLGGPPVCTLALELAASTSSIPCPVPPEGDFAFQALF
ncbi:unnamed protein product, partial [Larinioides sclopetarius]